MMFVADPPRAHQPSGQRGRRLAITALAFGCAAIVFGWIDGVGVAMGLTAVVCGSISLRSQHQRLALIGGLLGLVAMIGYAILRVTLFSGLSEPWIHA